MGQQLYYYLIFYALSMGRIFTTSDAYACGKELKILKPTVDKCLKYGLLNEVLENEGYGKYLKLSVWWISDNIEWGFGFARYFFVGIVGCVVLFL